MKRPAIAIISIAAFIFTLICVLQFAEFWWTVLRDSQRPEFTMPTGNFLSGPEAHIENSMLTITWAAKDEYQVNSIYFKKRWSRFVFLGGQDVDVEYDASSKIYHYSAQFRLSLPPAPKEGEYLLYLEPGIYTYQVWGNTADYSKKIASPVLDLDVSSR